MESNERALAPLGAWRFGVVRPGRPPAWSPWSGNIVCDGYGQVVAALLTGVAGYAGVGYIALGAGQAQWDALDLASYQPQGSEAQLEAELGRKAAQLVGYLTPDGLIGPALTNTPVWQAIWQTTELLNTALREAGLFGGQATNTANSGQLLTLKRFRAIQKTAADPFTLIVQTRLVIRAH